MLTNNFKNIFYLYVFISFSFAHAGSYEDFFDALSRDNARAVQSLLQRGLDPNTVNPKGQAALLVAIQGGALASAQVLVADPQTDVNVRNANQETPLMLAAIKGHADLCRQLISRDADINHPGWTPLHYAATGGHAEIVEMLLAHFAYIDAESPNQSTPLMLAARFGSLEAVQALLQAGADPNLRNALGLNALDFARHHVSPNVGEAIVALLQKSRPAGGSW